MNSEESKLSEFLENFSPISLRYRKPDFCYEPWVLWSESEGCESNSSSSAQVGTPMEYYDMIKSALTRLCGFNLMSIFSQFWAPVTVRGRRVLSTSGQPFAVRHLENKYAKYRLRSEKYEYNIHDDDDDANTLHTEPEHMIMSGGPASAFLNCRTSMGELPGFLLESADNDDDFGGFKFSVMLPIRFPSQTNCIGVLELSIYHSIYGLAKLLFGTDEAIQKAGLDVFYVQHLIPYKTVNGLKLAKDEIEKALEVVCAAHNLALAQVWIPFEDKINVPSLEDTQTKQMLAIKFTGYLYADTEDKFNNFGPYFRLGDVIPRASREELVMVTLQDYESRYVSELRGDMLQDWDGGYFDEISAFAICLRNNNTGDFNYVFEFLWIKRSNYVIVLEHLLLTLKRCLPRFKFASGAELGEELNVRIDEAKKFKIFEGKRSAPMPKALEEGNKPMFMDYMAHSKVTCKTAPKKLSRESIEKQYGKTRNDAAKNLHVSESTLKRKCKDLGILEWPGPNFMKRNKNDSSIIHTDPNEEDNGAVQEPSIINTNKNILTIKAEYADDIIKFNLPIPQATFVNIDNKISMKFKLIQGTYKLKYRDEVGDWILLMSDEEISDCIQSSTRTRPNEVRLRVLPSAQPLPGPSSIFST